MECYHSNNIIISGQGLSIEPVDTGISRYLEQEALPFRVKWFTVDLSYPNPNLRIELEGEILSSEYDALVKEINSSPRPEFQLVTKNYVDEQLNKYKNKEKRVGMFGGYFTIDDEDVYIKRVIYNNPVTIVFWSDGIKTRSTCHEKDIYNKEFGLSLCVMKRFMSNEQLNLLFSDWCVEEVKDISLKEVRKNKKNS